MPLLNYSCFLQTYLGHHLSTKDLQAVFLELYDARIKWNNIGLGLGTSYSDLAAIKERNRDDPDECFKDLLSHWLRQARPTWEAIVNALESRPVGYEQLAESVKKKYIDLPVPTQSNTVSKSSNGHQPTNEEHFHCPCGQCDLLSYLDNGCPKTSSKQYPYLELSELDEDDKEDLVQKLSEDITNIIQSFADLLSTTSKSLNRRNVTVDELVKVALDLGAFKSDKNPLPLLSEDRHKLQQANSINSAFITLGEHMSFFNYEILSHIINHLGNEEDKENLAKYCSQFETFCERKVFEVPPRVFDPSEQKRKNRKSFVVLGTDDLLQTISDVKAAQRKIASLLGLRVSTLRLERVDFGSVILVFSVPTSLEDLFPLDSSISEILISIGFTLIIPNQENHIFTGTDTFDQTSIYSFGLISNDSGFDSRFSSCISIPSLTGVELPRGLMRVMSPTSSHGSPSPGASQQRSLTRMDQLEKLTASFRRKNKTIGVFYDSKQKQKADSIVRRLSDLLSGGVCIIQGFEILPQMSDWLQRALLGGVDYFIFVGLPPSVTSGNAIQRSQAPQSITENTFFDVRRYVQRVAEVIVVFTEQRDSRYSRIPRYLDKFLCLKNENMDRIAEDALSLFAGE